MTGQARGRANNAADDAGHCGTTLRGVFDEMNAELRRQTEALQSGKPPVHIENYQPQFNPKNFGADMNSFKSRSVNGASRARDAEE